MSSSLAISPAWTFGTIVVRKSFLALIPRKRLDNILSGCLRFPEKVTYVSTFSRVYFMCLSWSVLIVGTRYGAIFGTSGRRRRLSATITMAK
jgi:hypothetical protein